MDATSKTDARVRVFARLRPAKPEEAEMGQMGTRQENARECMSAWYLGKKTTPVEESGNQSNIVSKLSECVG